MTRIPSQLPIEDEMNASVNDQAEASMPILGGSDSEVHDQEVLGIDSGGGSKNVVGSSVIIIVAVMLVASGALYGMHVMNNNLGQQEDSQAIEAKIETYLTKLNNPKLMKKDDPLRKENMDQLFQGTPEIINTLANNVEQHQIPIAYVKKDPFKMPRKKRMVAQNVNQRLSQQRKMQRLEELKGEVKRLDLQSVMGGRVPIAIINGEFYKVGQQVGSFTISKIHNNNQSVDLLAEGQTYRISMD